MAPVPDEIPTTKWERAAVARSGGQLTTSTRTSSRRRHEAATAVTSSLDAAVTAMTRRGDDAGTSVPVAARADPLHELERYPFGALEEAELPADVVHLVAEHLHAVGDEVRRHRGDVVDT